VKVDTGKPEEAKGRLIHLDAKPEAITLDPAMTAVIVVDMQNDFGSKGGMFDRAGIDISGIQKDYLCVLLADCMSEPIGHGLPQSNHDASLLSAEMALGWISDSERILKAVQP
jgi:hypothetical protein